MYDKMLIITAGLDDAERAGVVEAFGPSDPDLVLVPLAQADLDLAVKDVARAALEGGSGGGEGADTPWPMAFLVLFPRSRIDDFIAAFKSAAPRRGVFASLTPTNGEWTWRYLVEHLAEEHQQMTEMENRGTN